MKKNSKVACGALAVNLISGLLGLIYLISIGVGESDLTESVFPSAIPTLLTLAAVMTISTLVMIFALPKQR